MSKQVLSWMLLDKDGLQNLWILISVYTTSQVQQTKPLTHSRMPLDIHVDEYVGKCTTTTTHEEILAVAETVTIESCSVPSWLLNGSVEEVGEAEVSSLSTGISKLSENQICSTQDKDPVLKRVKEMLRQGRSLTATLAKKESY